MAIPENKQKMHNGELYHAFIPELVAERARCKNACQRLMDARETSRRRQVELWRDINGDTSPMPAQLPDPEEDAALFEDDPLVDPPIFVDYGTNVRQQKMFNSIPIVPSSILPSSQLDLELWSRKRLLLLCIASS